MKYAVFVPLDQTIGYLADFSALREVVDGDPDDLEFGVTTDPGEALLWLCRGEAQIVAHEEDGYVEEIADEAEFRAREKTWVYCR